jgi:hypothetical protein
MPFPPYTSDDGLGSIPDVTVRRYLEPLELVEEGGCTFRSIQGERFAMHCRAFVRREMPDHPGSASGSGDIDGPDTPDERFIGVYDRISDTLLVLISVDPEGRQNVVWKMPDAPAPEVVEGVSL